MKFTNHIIINATIGGIICFIINRFLFFENLLIVVASGVLIDIDHVFVEIFKGTLRHPRKVIEYWKSIPNKHTGELYIFHSYEFMFAILVLGLQNKFFLIVLIGLILHFLADGLINYLDTKSFSWLRDYSIIFKIYDHWN
jgi:hypothetical protein